MIFVDSKFWMKNWLNDTLPNNYSDKNKQSLAEQSLGYSIF